ncbi:hypothetical protein RRG08_041246, partial [Elysia crispata]
MCARDCTKLKRLHILALQPSQAVVLEQTIHMSLIVLLLLISYWTP